MYPIVQKFGQFTAAGSPAAVNLDLGFIPDEFEMVGETSGSSDIVFAKWLKTMGEATGYKSVGSGTNSYLTTGGFTSYTLAGSAPKVKRWAASTAYAVGDVVRPVTTPSGWTQESLPLFKCTSAGTSNSTEPTWVTTTVNVSTTTDSGATWTYMDSGTLNTMEEKMLTGYGITIPAALQTASKVYDWVARGRQPNS